MRVLVDTNIVLDVLLQREPFVSDSAAIWLANEQERFEGYITAVTVVNVFYIARKQRNATIARSAVVELLKAFRICPLDRDALRQALNLPMRDYEDAVQVAGANATQLDGMITR